jgi:hypothetical protein
MSFIFSDFSSEFNPGSDFFRLKNFSNPAGLTVFSSGLDTDS